jgi:hypothetical protein
MQFGKVQGVGLAALGFLLLALQLYIFFGATSPSGSPSQAPAVSSPASQVFKFAPGIIGALVLAGGVYLLLLQRNQGTHAETPPHKTKSGVSM